MIHGPFGQRKGLFQSFPGSFSKELILDLDLEQWASTRYRRRGWEKRTVGRETNMNEGSADMFGDWGVVHYGDRGGSALIKDDEQLLWKWRLRPNGNACLCHASTLFYR